MTSAVPVTLEPALRINTIDFSYGNIPALSNVSLGVEQGSIIGLVGRNGAGKSTLINVLAGLLEPSKGTIEIFGGSSAGQGEAVMRVTGWLLSEPALFQYLTPSETLDFLADAYRLDRSVGSARVADLLHFFELDAMEMRLADELSTGNLKRLALAAAMIHAPRLLVLDEPFESLDPLMVRRLRHTLVAYARRGGSVLLSSHLLEVVQDICDYVYILESGKIVFEGAAEQFRAASTIAGEGTALEALYASVVEPRAEHELLWL
jgi:ABC-2 type transport system ATP-binding protein